MATLEPAELDLLRALLDRLIPADEFPGALAAGVENYVQRQLAGDLAPRAASVAAGLRRLDAEARARHDRAFTALAAAEQDALLAGLEAGRPATAWPEDAAKFFDLMLNLAAEGFYADPGNGGNRGAVAWRMIGYDPRVPAPRTP